MEDEPSKGSKEYIVNPFAVPPELCVPPRKDNVEDADAKAAKAGKEQSGAAQARRTIHLTFPKSGLQGNETANEVEGEGGEGEKKGHNMKQLLLGACDINEVGSGKTGTGGSFSFREIDSNDSSKYFTIAPSSGAAKPGEELPVECKFTPPEVPGEDGATKACVIVGQWVEVVYECVLKGGYAPPGESDEEIVNVVLRGFVVQ